jgi:hypothetical protein
LNQAFDKVNSIQEQALEWYDYLLWQGEDQESKFSFNNGPKHKQDEWLQVRADNNKHTNQQPGEKPVSLHLPSLADNPVS